jgi:hypothetical protein
MRLAHKSGWALAAASSLGVGLGLSPAASPIDPAPAALTAAAPTTSATTEEEARLAEIKVELAWLTDPLTFPCDLAVRAVHGALEIGGDVPREATRVRAVALAREHGKMPVIDKIAVIPSSTVPPVKVNYDQLNVSVAKALGKIMVKHPAEDNQFNLAIDSGGQVTVSGTALSCEEKLSISRKLSSLSGCTSVMNQFAIKALVRDGKTFTPITTDGRLVIAGEPSKIMPTAVGFVPPNGVAVLPPVGPASTSPAAPTQTLPVATTLPPLPALPPGMPAQLPDLAPHTASATAPPAAVQTLSVATPPAASSPYTASATQAAQSYKSPYTTEGSAPAKPETKPETAPVATAPAPLPHAVSSVTEPPPPAWPTDTPPVTKPEIAAAPVAVEKPKPEIAAKPVVPAKSTGERVVLVQPPPPKSSWAPASPVAPPAPASPFSPIPSSGSTVTTSAPAAPSTSVSPYGGVSGPVVKSSTGQSPKPVASVSPAASPYGVVGETKTITPTTVASNITAGTYGGAWSPDGKAVAPVPAQPAAPSSSSDTPFAHVTPVHAPSVAKVEPKTLPVAMDPYPITRRMPVGPDLSGSEESEIVVPPMPTPTPPPPVAPPPVAPTEEKPESIFVPVDRSESRVPVVPPPVEPVKEVKPAVAQTSHHEPAVIPDGPALPPVMETPVALPVPPPPAPVVHHDEPKPVVSQPAPKPVPPPAPAVARPTPVPVAVARPTPQPIPPAPPLRPIPDVVQAAPGVSPDHARVVRKIELTCAGKASDVMIRFPEEKTCVVHMRIDDRVEAVKLAHEIMNLPELVPYKVNLDVPKPVTAMVLPPSAQPMPPVAIAPAYAKDNGNLEPAPDLAKQQSRIRKEIKRVCADRAEDIHVHFPADHKVLVQLKVRSDGDGKILAPKIMALQDLEGYTVDLDMPVVPKLESVVLSEHATLPASVTAPKSSKPTTIITPTVSSNSKPKGSAVYPGEEGVVQVSATSTSTTLGEAKPGLPGTGRDISYLRNLVAEVCGVQANDVKVEFKTDTDCLISLRARTETDAEKMGNKVLYLPELEPYKVKLEFTLSR